MDKKRLSVIKGIQGLIKEKRLFPLLITNINNIRYLTGFSGTSGFCLLTGHETLFFTDFRYTEQAESEVMLWTICLEKGKRIDTIKKALRKLGIKKIGFESSQSYMFYQQMMKLGVEIKAYENLIEKYREIKDDEELMNIKEAYTRAEDAMIEIKNRIKPGVKESEIALRLEMALRQKGCKRIPFEIIVASGSNSSKPHATVTDKYVEKGDFVIIDWGGECNGYFSDITRTFLMKDSDLDKKAEIYEIVRTACKQAILSVREGVKASDVDKAARNYIVERGFGENFGHGTGHGIGLQSHEEPRINKLNNKPLKDGMVFTIEPGIYIRSFGGVRIEETVAITKGKNELLCKLPNELEILG